MFDLDKEILATTLELDGNSVTVKDLLLIDETKLSDEFAKQASKFAYVGLLAAEAEAEVLQVKAEKDEVYAEADLAIRDEFEKLGKKSTEALIRSEVLLDDAYNKVLRKESEATERWHKLRVLADATRQRGDMLISLGATLRAEFDVTNMSLLKTKQNLSK